MNDGLMFDFETKPRVTVPDITEAFLRKAAERGTAAIDIETSGLDWRSQRIGLCQLYVPGCDPVLIKAKKSDKPERMLALLGASGIRKVFHHAMFDLRFLCYHWGAQPRNIACTKIASKLIDPEQVDGHSLSQILEKYLGIKVDKSQQQSDWLSWDLSDSQVAYASSDVIYLPQLYENLMTLLDKRSLSNLATRCFEHIPTRVELEILGYRDVYLY
jgi:ribonuclease D